MKVREEQQRFVASNAVSLAEALFWEEAWFRAIYDGETPVGFVMLYDETLRKVPPANPKVFLGRFMVDARFQGKGIGAATAYLAAERGYAVCVNYLHNKEVAQKIVDEIEQLGRKAIAVSADVASETDVIALFNTVDEKLGTVTALVNNAGIIEQQMQVENMDATRLHRIFATNVIGSFMCAREAVKRMSTKHDGVGGAIVNVSSVASRLGSPGEYVDYAASKGAIDTMTIGLASEVAEAGIRVNAVRPGFIDTDIHASGGEPNRIERVKEFVPMKRGGQAIEVAQAILWLLSDEASYTTGSFIEVAGGK